MSRRRGGGSLPCTLVVDREGSIDSKMALAALSRGSGRYSPGTLGNGAKRDLNFKLKWLIPLIVVLKACSEPPCVVPARLVTDVRLYE